VNENGVVISDFQREFADGFEERQSFDIAGGAADLGDDDVGFALLPDGVDAVLDLIGDVRDDLHGFAEVFAFALVVKDSLVDLAAGQVVQAREFGIGETLVMAKVEIVSAPSSST